MSSIGVFDSGVGGLTVLEALCSAFPKENFIYLADTARLPYGSKSIETIHAYLRQNVGYLINHQVKAVVVACNSASTALLKYQDSFSIPVFNVIQPGSRLAVAATKNEKIAVMGTRATVLSQAYPKTINQLNPNISVTQVATPLLVPLVEEGWIDDPVTNLIVYRYLSGILRDGADTLIMGCTHYPALKKAIQKASPPDVTLIDSNAGVVSDLEAAYASGKIEKPTNVSSESADLKILCTDLSPRMDELIKLLLKARQPLSVEHVTL